MGGDSDQTNLIGFSLKTGHTSAGGGGGDGGDGG